MGRKKLQLKSSQSAASNRTLSSFFRNHNYNSLKLSDREADKVVELLNYLQAIESLDETMSEEQAKSITYDVSETRVNSTEEEQVTDHTNPIRWTTDHSLVDKDWEYWNILDNVMEFRIDPRTTPSSITIVLDEESNLHKSIMNSASKDDHDSIKVEHPETPPILDTYVDSTSST